MHVEAKAFSQCTAVDRSVVINVMLFQSSLRPDSLPLPLLVHLLLFVSQFLPYLIGTDALLIVIIVISHFGYHLSGQPIIFPTQDPINDVFWVEQQMKKIIVLCLGIM